MTFAAQLARDVVVGSRAVLRAGTKVTGRVASSRALSFSPVILDVTELASNGRAVRIQTVEGFRTDGNLFKTRRGVGVGSGGFFQIPTGTTMQFRLAKPVNI